MLLLYNMVRNLISCPFPHCSDVVGWPTVECDCSLEPAEIVYYKSYRDETRVKDVNVLKKKLENLKASLGKR